MQTVDMETQTPSLQEYVAEEIRVLLTRRRLSATRLAKDLGWSQAQLSRKLSSQAKFSLDDLNKIAQVLNVPLIALLPAETISTWSSLLQGAAA